MIVFRKKIERWKDCCLLKNVAGWVEPTTEEGVDYEALIRMNYVADTQEPAKSKDGQKPSQHEWR